MLSSFRNWRWKLSPFLKIANGRYFTDVLIFRNSLRLRTLRDYYCKWIDGGDNVDVYILAEYFCKIMKIWL